MLFKDGDFILTAQLSVQLQHWPRNGACSGKKNSDVKLARSAEDVRELHTGLVQQVPIAAVSLDFPTARADVMEQTCESHTGSWSRPCCIKEGLAAQYFCSVKVICFFKNLKLVFHWFMLSSALLTHLSFDVPHVLELGAYRNIHALQVR